MLQGLEGLCIGEGSDFLKVCGFALSLSLSVIRLVTLVLPELLISRVDAVWWLDSFLFLIQITVSF